MVSKNLFLALKLMAPQALANGQNAQETFVRTFDIEKNSVQYFTYYVWHYGSRHPEVLLRIRQNH